MISWSIDAARSSGCFDRIIVSTDDQEIATVAQACGAEIPFLRPARLADDHTGTIPVIAHAIEWSRREGATPLHVCCLYATAPFVRAEDLKGGLDLLEKEACDYVFPVTSYSFPIQRALRLTENGRVEMFHPEHFTTRSQDLEEAYHDAGQFYWGTAEAWCAGKPIFSPAATPFVLPRFRVQDIDTPEDWKRAEWMFQTLQAGY